ncbi:MAG TPA: LPS assembly protein LptD, partial [Steroidobacteraceae bacterium]|nr:LPS assembly protein LptD [Steroidobacteraceae bacterium]
MAGIPVVAHGAGTECPSDVKLAQAATAPLPRSESIKGKPVGLDEKVDVTADEAQVGVNGNANLKGNVVVKQGDREIKADNAHYAQDDNAFKVEGHVDYDDPIAHITGGGGNYSQTKGADFHDAQFELKERSAHGEAKSMQMTPEGLINLQGVNFSTCPVEDPAWQLKADSITLDTKSRVGTGRNTQVNFKGVPIMYLPWMSFPLGDERKSGFLFPTIGHSTRSGFLLSVPYYWNIAPNADLTFEPTEYSTRGLDAAGEARLLTERTNTKLTFNYLPNDSVANRDRNRFLLENITELPGDFRFFINAEAVSDSRYFEDFSTGPEGTSIAFLERLAGLTYRDEHWRMSAEVQQFQTIDQDVDL